jgi:surface antigen
LRRPASPNALLNRALYRAWEGVGLSAFAPKGAALTLIVIGLSAGGCSLNRPGGAFAQASDAEVTGALGGTGPTPSDLAFARNAASDVLTKGDKDSSQPWQNPETGARGSVTPLAQAYSDDDGRTCRDFLASYVNGTNENWLQGSACHSGNGRWEIHTLKPWRQG